jgi:hypothetical protein
MITPRRRVSSADPLDRQPMCHEANGIGQASVTLVTSAGGLDRHP